MKQALIYTFKVALTTACLSPVIFFVLFGYEIDNDGGFIILWLPIAIGLGAGFSLPGWILLYLTQRALTIKSFNILSQKVVLGILASLLGPVTIILVRDWEYSYGAYYEMLSVYAVTSVVCIWLYKLRLDSDTPIEPHSTQ